MCVDMAMRFSMKFGHEKFTGKFPVIFNGTGTGMPVYSGNKLFENSSHSKFGHTENPQENAGSILPK